MKTEKIIISFVAIIIGIIAAGVIFYLYQTTRSVSPQGVKTITIKSPSPTPAKTIFLTLDSPKNESVADTKSITVSGSTTPDAAIIISSDSQDLVVKPTTTGKFSATVGVGDGQNVLEIVAIGPTGQEAKETRTITFSTENF